MSADCEATQQASPDATGTTSTTIDPLFMIQQIAALNAANGPDRLQHCSKDQSAPTIQTEIEILQEENDALVVAAKTLWDLAADTERTIFLHEHHLLDVISLILLSHERHRPRLTELCLGTVANMAAVPIVAQTIGDDANLPTILLRVWMTCADAPTLSELARLFMGLATLPVSSVTWHQILGAAQPLNQLLCLAMNASEPLLLSRLSGLLLSLCHNRDIAYTLADKQGPIPHFPEILGHLVAQEWQAQRKCGGEWAALSTPWGSTTTGSRLSFGSASLAGMFRNAVKRLLDSIYTHLMHMLAGNSHTMSILGAADGNVGY